MWRLCSSWSKLKARWGAAGAGGLHSEVRRRASALALSVVGETGAARRAARSASAPPTSKEEEGGSSVGCWWSDLVVVVVVDDMLSVGERGLLVRVWIGRVVVVVVVEVG